MLICFDIDGTLADLSHRLHYWREKPKNWNMFTSEMINDTPIEAICNIAGNMHYQGHTVILCSGRSEDTRGITTEWLLDVACVTFDKLYMRAEKDYRSDDIVKKELLDQIVVDFGQKPDIWFDDRPRVVKMLRENGVFVADVYQGTEDF
jgi:hydroxymethylpyrimidine pyrophosphatase-like HAD family hydrolase